MRDQSTRVCKAARSWDPLASPLWGGAPQWEVRRAVTRGFVGPGWTRGASSCPRAPHSPAHRPPRLEGPCCGRGGAALGPEGCGQHPRAPPTSSLAHAPPPLTPKSKPSGGFSPGPSHFPPSAPFPHRAPGVWLNCRLLSRRSERLKPNLWPGRLHRLLNDPSGSFSHTGRPGCLRKVCRDGEGLDLAFRGAARLVEVREQRDRPRAGAAGGAHVGPRLGTATTGGWGSRAWGRAVDARGRVRAPLALGFGGRRDVAQDVRGWGGESRERPMGGFEALGFQGPLGTLVGCDVESGQRSGRGEGR